MKTTRHSKLFFWTKIFIAIHLDSLYQFPQVVFYNDGHLEFTFWLPGTIVADNQSAGQAFRVYVLVIRYNRYW